MSWHETKVELSMNGDQTISNTQNMFVISFYTVPCFSRDTTVFCWFEKSIVLHLFVRIFYNRLRLYADVW